MRIEISRPNFYPFVDSIFVDTYCDPAVPADANGSCQLNGIDIVYIVNYLKGGAAPHFCATCPTSRLLVAEEKKAVSHPSAQ